uniref:GPS domain-containing protein n=1 Tax=Ditylenchus dipsaci TaxID=166011 RepID=A0A915ER50_9BILA
MKLQSHSDLRRCSPGTKATLNEAFDKVLRQTKNCFAQLETTDPNLDWLEFDSALLMFMTTSEVPFSSNEPHQAILHLMCASNKMRSIHFSIQITKRNRHPPKFLTDTYHFYAPASLKLNTEVGRVHVVDHDPIIYNSRIHITVVKAPPSGSISALRGGLSSRGGQSSDEIDAHWKLNYGGQNDDRFATLQTLHSQAASRRFWITSAISTVNVTIVPVSVSQPHNLRVNVANLEYQIFEWDSPTFGIPEKYRLSISKAGKVLYTQDVDAGENIVMSKMHFPAGPEYSATITAVDVEGEAPSEPHVFMLINTELYCEGECSPRGGIPMCYYGKFHKIEQYRDINGLHCLCYDGYSSAQCDTMETCATEKAIESYGGVAWPMTPVNQSSTILCPYNSNGEVIRRKCVWDDRLDVARWENVSNNELCKKQSSILVHLGVLANFAQRNEQTVSGFKAVQRFLDTVLQFPSFNPNISTAHFDSKIAEHVAQVIDGIASRNLSLVPGNTTEIRASLTEYIKDFMHRLPVPFDLRSSGEGFQMKTWHWTGPQEDQGEESKIGGSTGADETDDGSLPVQLGRRCYVHLPAKPALDHSSAIQGDSEVVRVACLKTSTLYPHLDGRSPVLFLEIDEEYDQEDRDYQSSSSKTVKTRILPAGSKALIGLRPELSTAMIGGGDEPTLNYTCAYYDENEHTWSITGINVLSRNFENGFVLCETTHLSVFSLLPESMFTSKKMTSLESMAFVLPIATAFVAIVCTLFLLLIAIFQRAKYTDPALITFLLTILLVHLVHFTVLITPHFSSNMLQPWDTHIYLLLQYALVSVGALVALLNSAIHTRIAAIELDTLKGLSHWSRLVQVFTIAIVIPICLCITTWLLDGYVFYGVTTRNPTLLAFNWTFTATFLIPIVICVGCAIGYGCYCLCYGNSLAKQQEALVFYQRSNVTKSLILAMLHLSLSLAVFLFAGYLYRIELKFPRFSTHHFNNTNTTSDSRNSHRNGHSGAFTAVNTEIYEEPIQQKHYKDNGNGLSPKVITSNTNVLASAPSLNETLKLRSRNNSIMGDHILSRHSFLDYKEKGAMENNTLRRQLYTPLVKANVVVGQGSVGTNGYFKTSAVQRQESLARLKFLQNGRAVAKRIVKAKFADEEDSDEIIREEEEQRVIERKLFSKREKDRRGSLASASSSSELSHPLVSVV